jgi:hypothetical protein
VKIYDFLCPNGHLEEHVVKSWEHDRHLCDTCGEVGIKQLSAPPCILEGHSGSFPGAAMKWERDHEKAGRGSHFQDE